MKHFIFYSRHDVLNTTRIRRFETKLGECIQVVADKNNWEEALQQSMARYVLFGIPEDIGIRANHGKGGADSAWQSFLSSFLNIQSNDFLNGEELLLLGHFDFSNAIQLIEQNAYSYEEKIDAYRHAVVTIDEAVEELTKIITSQGKIPIAIGGGHNNAYPLIKGAAKGLHKAGLIPLAQINAINMDAHADFRPAEGRHSGNGFRYAEEDGYLQKYCVVALHESYLQQNVWLDIVNNPFLDFITYEDIFILEKRNFLQAVAHATSFTEENYTGVELDLDCVENVQTSAMTPSGLTALHARQYVTMAARESQVAYLHVCEGMGGEMVGKLIGYLVADFVKSNEGTSV